MTRSTWKRIPLLLLICFFAGTTVNAQGIFTGINNTVINLTCDQPCTNLNFQVPHLKSDDDYTVASIPYTPYPYTTSTGNELTALYADDKYSQLIALPYPICFYGAVYNAVVVGSNGLLTFDGANANCDGAYTVSPTIPNNTGIICQQEGIYYPKAAIMGTYSDLDPGSSASPAGRKIEWRIEGVAPFRRFVASWNRIGVFGNNSCGLNTPTTFQIVINESTSVIEVFFEQKICSDGSNNGRSILGIQDFSRTKAVAARNKNSTVWTSVNEGYRFVPSGATSRFIRSDIFLLNGTTPLSTATAADVTPGLMDISFNNVCLTGTSQKFVVKTYYSSCIDPTQSVMIEDTITLNRNPELNASVASTNNTQCGAPSGSIQIAVPAGTGTSPYTFTLNPGPGQTQQTGPAPMTFSNLAQGTYTVVVTDASGNCNSTLTNITVGRTNNLAANVNPVATSCPTTSDGRILVTPTTGSAPYTFILNPGAVTQTGPTANFPGLAPGTYNVTVSDASGCSIAPISATITSGPGLSTTASKTDALCNGTATGTITVTQPVMGTPPYEYSLDGITWQTSNTFTGLAPGPYTVRYRESGGCSGTVSVNIAEPPVLSATATATDAACNGEANGVINVTPAGGVGPYEYSIDGGATWQPSNSFNVTAGNYTVTIRDANACTTTQPAIVSEPPVLSASSTNTAASCDGGNDGKIDITAAGGNTGYQYSIDGVNFQPSNVFDVAPGNYTVTVKDSKGCTISFATTVALGNNFSLTPQSDVIICEGTSTQLSLTSNATEYSWTPATGLSATNIHNPVANPTVTTEYIVTATLGRCSGEDRVTVTVNTAPVPDAGANGFICYGQTYQLHAGNGVKYAWSPATYLDDPASANPVATPLRDMTYKLSIIEDANGCASLVTDDVFIDVTPPIKVKTFPFDTVVYSNDQFRILAVPSDPDVINYSWTPSTGLSDANVANPIVTAGAVGDVIQYRVVTSTIAGCKGEAFVTVKVYKGPDIYVPTGFTPNNDGKNDIFLPVPVGVKSYKYFRVFDRWGHMVFSGSTMHDGWDGRLIGKEQPTGTYVWMIEGITNENKVIIKKGTVVLIR